MGGRKTSARLEEEIAERSEASLGQFLPDLVKSGKIAQNSKVCNCFTVDWCFALISTLGKVKFLRLSKMLWFPLSLHSVANYSRKAVRTFYLSKPWKLAQMQS